MAIRVKLPNGKYASFPDDMPHEDIEKVLQKQFAPNANNAPKEESQGFLSKLPRNIAIGLANLGHSTLNTPSDLAQLAEQRGKEFGMNLKIPGPEIKTKEYKPISSYIPRQEEHNFAEMLGQKGNPTLLDSFIQKGVEFSPEIMSGYGLMRNLPLTQRMASRHLRQARNMAHERNVNELNVNPELLEESRQFMNMNNPDVQRLYQESQQGGFNSLMSLQSDVGVEARSLRKSPLAAERRQAPHAENLKQRLLTDIRRELTAQGHEDIADLVGRGINKYRQYKKIEENVYPILKRLGIPIGIGASIIFGWNKGKKLLND